MADESAPDTVRIAIADDHPIFRSGLRELLETEPGCVVVGEAADGTEAVDLVASSRPDVLLLDLSMPQSGGLDALRELGRRGLSVRTVILTAEIDPDEVVEALKLGAVGVVLKSAATEELFNCIRAVVAGQYWVNRGTMRDLVEALREYEAAQAGGSRRPYDLTPRERAVVAAVLAGKSNKEIARDLNVVEQTVKNYLGSIYDKLGVSSRLELAVLARDKGLPGLPAPPR